MHSPPLARWTVRILASLLVLLTVACRSGSDSSTDAGQSEDYEVREWASGLSYPTAIAFLPDGSALVTEKGGFGEGLGVGRVVHVTPGRPNEVALVLSVCTEFERGLVGLALSSEFESDHWVYLYRTTDDKRQCVDDPNRFSERTGSAVNRLSRFSWNGKAIDPGSEQVILETSGSNKGHQGGGLAFGPDGMLYVGVGNNSSEADPSGPSRNLQRLEGKVLRTTGDPTNPVPSDNPHLGNPNANPLIWASGFRNPFSVKLHPTTGATIVGDVGSVEYEELNVVRGGADYGWPQREGLEPGPQPGDASGTVDPIHVYSHSDRCNAVIAGGFVTDNRLGDNSEGTFAFTDFQCGKVWLLDLDEPSKGPRQIARVEGATSYMTIGPDGMLYLLEVNDPAVVRQVGPGVAQADEPPAKPGLFVRIKHAVKVVLGRA